MVAQVVNVDVDENVGTLTELIGAHATHNGDGTTQIYTVDGTALNGQDFFFTPTTGYDSGGHGHEGITYPANIQIVDNSITDGSKYFDLYGSYPNGNTIDYHITINQNDDPFPITQAEKKFIKELNADRSAFGSHPFQEIGKFIRGHYDDFLAAATDASQVPGVTNAATLSGQGEIKAGAELAALGAVIAAKGGAAGLLIGEAVIAGGALIALHGALSTADLSNIGAEIKHELSIGK